MLNKLKTNCNQILFLELAGLLHDIGKLSEVFLKYRQTWQSDPGGYDKDPHDHLYFENHEVFKELIPPDFFKKIESGECSKDEPNFSIKEAVHSHVEPGSGALLNMALKAADGVDSAIDRNNPLWSAEQKGTIFRSNVFGYEKCRDVTFECQEKVRKELYVFLGKYLPEYFKKFDYDDRKAILSGIKKAFEIGLSDTTRPQNDTSLWEHSYSVASIFKALVVHNLFNDNDKIYKREGVKFGILGIGWNGVRFLSYGHKIGDIIGRKNVIENIKDHIRKLVEYDYPIGNEIYADDDGVYFIVPARLEDNLKTIYAEIEDKIYATAAKCSDGELQPHLSNIKETTTLTALALAIQDLREKRSYPFDNSVKGFRYFDAYQEHFKDKKTVCPICRLRPVEEEDDPKKICVVCRKRRTQEVYGNRDTGISKRNETVFVDEIVDDKKRAALIVARFGLDDWLNGKMVRSLFVTETKGIEKEIKNLGNVKPFEIEEKIIKEFLSKQSYGNFNYNRIKADIDAFSADKDNDRAYHAAFLYDRRVLYNTKVLRNSLFRDTKETKKAWDKCLSEARKEHRELDIYNFINAKTPTPSTILDVWETTHEFLKELPGNILECLLPENKRLELDVQLKQGKSIDNWDKGTIQAEVVSTKGKIELLHKGKETFGVVGEMYSAVSSNTKWQNKHIRIIDKEGGVFGNLYEVNNANPGDTVVPYRTITMSPNLFMAIVPAKRAIEITDVIYRKYRDYFGKVMGRLPFSIGNIFFGNKMPMFAILDAGNRMIANFDNLGKYKNKNTFVVKQKPECSESNIKFDLTSSIGGFYKTIAWHLPHKLGNCDKDYHHPYFIVDTNGNDLSSVRSTFFKTVVGDVVHFTEIEKGDKLCVYPNYYDFEFLDSNTRRHDICLDTQLMRKSNVAHFTSKPFLLDELSQKIMRLWKGLLQGRQLKGNTDTKLRNLQTLWLTKYQEWSVNIGHKTTACYEQWINLVISSIQKEFKEIDNEQCSLLQETIENGLFFDTLELYLGILKERIDIK